ncbi:TIGR00730 family Rossman fold protein [Amycolatopsis sp. NPDC051758]|uniref:TIGR00730 family Rossman fold protein n=1 Tax=Amycolatopsis sp. NPDC051758 TaxID=3363935 RepID=UPI0037ACBA7B
MHSRNRKPAQICVFCGAKSGTFDGYTEFAERLGTELARQDIGLVYGGSRLGLMGSIAQAVLAEGGAVTGIIPAHLIEKEKAAGGNTQLFVVKSMHERKNLMYRLSDGFVALPGGFGTMDELLEIATWAKLSLHTKPITVANVDGYFDSVLTWFDRAVTDGFVGADERGLVRSAETVDEVLEHLHAGVEAAELPV